MNSMMICPVVPDLSAVPAVNWLTLVGFILLLASAVTAAICLARFAAEKFHGDKSRAIWLFAGITGLLTIALICFFGLAATTIRGIIFSLVLLYSSYQDIKTRECDDFLHILIVVAAFIGTEPTALPGMVLSAVTVFGIMIAALVITKSDIGGADIKLASACAFLLGMQKGLVGLMLGLAAAVIVNTIKNRKKDMGFPMIPYLAAGFTAAYFI